MQAIRDRILAVLEYPLEEGQTARLSSVLLALGDVWGRALHRMSPDRREAVAAHALTLLFASMQELGMDTKTVAAFAEVDAVKLRQKAQQLAAGAPANDDEPTGSVN